MLAKFLPKVIMVYKNLAMKVHRGMNQGHKINRANIVLALFACLFKYDYGVARPRFRGTSVTGPS